ncbi:MAG: hypothetical protein F6K62_23770 [Sphaerospermopsis sp. SIO1G2]|nr:hypothetical protein [Sphaerospermopsis sp. SIO1G2]
MTTDNLIEGEGYSVEYNSGTKQVAFRGTMRLKTSADYAPINTLLEKAYDDAGEDKLVLDFRQLQFLNSSGINTVSRFVITSRKKNAASLAVIGSKDIYWQQKSLTNLQRLWKSVEIDIQ